MCGASKFSSNQDGELYRACTEFKSEPIGDPTYADAILDRLVHNAHRLNLTGDSLRKTRSKTAEKT